jgi:hypothetical protein
MKKGFFSVALLAIAGCSMMPNNPSPQSGLLIQYYTPPVVHLPVVTDPQAGGTQTTHIGSHKVSTTTQQPVYAPMPLVPVPKVQPQGGNGCDQPCRDE